MSAAPAGEVDAAVAAKVAALRQRVHGAARRADRDPETITIVGVAKRQSPERIVAAVRAGIAHVGENYVQEARAKRAQVSALLESGGLPAPCWHMVGGLQRNKARQAIGLFDVFESVDRAELARELDRRAAQSGGAREVLLQVNQSAEPQKSGVPPDALPELLAACAPLAHLRVSGLMTVPAASEEPEDARGAFARLRELRDTLRGARGGEGLRELSMGMSADFEIAIEEGATLVRIGTALFGTRDALADTDASTATR